MLQLIPDWCYSALDCSAIHQIVHYVYKTILLYVFLCSRLGLLLLPVSMWRWICYHWCWCEGTNWTCLLWHLYSGVEDIILWGNNSKWFWELTQDDKLTMRPKGVPYAAVCTPLEIIYIHEECSCADSTTLLENVYVSNSYGCKLANSIRKKNLIFHNMLSQFYNMLGQFEPNRYKQCCGATEIRIHEVNIP